MRKIWGIGLLSMTWLAGGVLADQPAPRPREVDDLARYLVEAKRDGYASGDESRIVRLDDGGSEVRSASGAYVYRDRWYGDERFTGQEIVWRDGQAIWGLSFYGATTTGRAIPPDFPRFHKAALRRATVSAPFRGPARYREGDFVYLNSVTGSLEEFKGSERVLFRSKEIFHLTYHGGLLRHAPAQ
jgi:hypothetical protein